MYSKHVASCLLVVILLMGFVQVTPAAAQADSGVAWPTATPEEQGIHSDKLAGMLAAIAERDLNIHSVSIIRHGALVLDAYQPPASPSARHIIHSCTKSVTSILIGIAIEQGYIEGVDQPVLDFFPDRTFDHLDASKESITLEDVLMMASGLDCRDSYLYRWQGLNEMSASADWVQHFLSLPMAHEPGTHFEYCNGGTYLLGQILEAATGMNTLDFADQYLFAPLGITDWLWYEDPVGGAITWGGLQLRPLDMAKIGYLYLHGGQWGDGQIVSPEWVAASTREHIPAGTLASGYGYQWWIDDGDIYSAKGYAGQFIFVIPDQDMVVVFTSGLREVDFNTPELLLRYYIMPAVESDKPLPTNDAAFEALQAQINALANPEPDPAPSLPEITASISGQVYAIQQPNVYDITALALTFEPGSDTAGLSVSGGVAFQDAAVGLDGVFRTTETNGQPAAMRGEWRRDVVVLTMRDLLGPVDAMLRFRFDGDTIVISMRNRVTGEATQLSGTRAE